MTSMCKEALLLLFVWSSASAQTDLVDSRCLAPSHEQVAAVINGATAIFGDTVLTNRFDQELKKAHFELTGFVVSYWKGSPVHVREFNKGKVAGTWYVLTEDGHVSQVTDYSIGDSVSHIYFYGPNRRLNEHCVTDREYPEPLRIFGGTHNGTCTDYDLAGRIIHTITQEASGKQIRSWFYANGQIARRGTNDVNGYLLEFFCATGKRVGYFMYKETEQEGGRGTTGAGILWSRKEQRHFLYSLDAGRARLRKSPFGLWRHFGENEFYRICDELEMELIPNSLPNDLLGPVVELPCWPRRR
jgi:hypothetical protein